PSPINAEEMESHRTAQSQGVFRTLHLVPMQAVTNLHRILPEFRDVPIRHLNESTSQDVALTARQTARIHALYRQDAVLYDRSVKEADRFR
ncbi:hypothetical protein NO221_10665, partial [Gluconacetobacter entanii]|nr:hypothetical protein [Gluconacetobacter entanii]MCW4584178.1 hypothetical protein [Gluconacetobacter entanii]MCW4587522.1 hypothetical protein [Gluconacetobacter entanii]